MKEFYLRMLLTGLLVVSSALFAIAQDPPPDAPPTPPGGAQRPTAPSTDPQPYDKVITKDAKTKDGVFKVHQIKDKFYYEIPKAELDKEFLWVAQIAKTTLGVGYGGQALGRRVVRWERNDNRIFLRNVNYSIVANPALPIAEAVQNSNTDSIIMAFPVAAFGPNDSVVIEVTRLFSTDVFELERPSAFERDSSRCDAFIHRANFALPDQYRGPFVDDIHPRSAASRCRRCGTGRWCSGRWNAARKRDGCSPPEHGQTARKSDDAASF